MKNRILLTITLAALSFWLSINMLRPIFPLFVSDLGAQPAEVGFIVAIPSLLSIFLRVPLTSGVAKIGRFRFLGIALLINALSLIFYGLANSLSLVYMARILHSLAIAAFGPVAIASVSLLAPIRKKGEVVGTYLTVIAIAIVVGPGLAAILLSFIGYSELFILAAIPTSIFAVIIMFYKNNDNYESPKKVSLRGNIKAILSNRNFLLISLSALTYSLALGFFRAFFPLYVEETYLLDAAFVSTLFTVRGLFNVMIRPLTGKFSSKIGIKKLIISGMIITSFSFIIIFLKLPLYSLFVALALSGVGWGMRAVSSVSYIGIALGEKEQEVGMALFFNMFDIGVFIGSTSGGIISYFIPINVLFGIYSLILLLGGLILVFIESEDKILASIEEIMR
jgi:predicted MFS family arabinose efflux permease